MPLTPQHGSEVALCIIGADGVSWRLKSNGNNERGFRILVEDGIN